MKTSILRLFMMLLLILFIGCINNNHLKIVIPQKASQIEQLAAKEYRIHFNNAEHYVGTPES